MLPVSLLDFEVVGGLARPSFLRDSDLAWLRVVVDETTRFVGRPWGELQRRLAEPMPMRVSPKRVAVAVHVLRQFVGRADPPIVDAQRVRSMVFGAAARLERERLPERRQQLIIDASADLGVAPELIPELLFADLPGERLVGDLPVGFSPSELMLQANFTLAQSLLGKATRVMMRVDTNARALVRHAQRSGLICLARSATPGVVLDFSGPFAVIRRTLVYARALGGVLPYLAQCPGFRIEAHVVLAGQTAKLVLDSADPLFPMALPPSYDSKLEQAFATDFLRFARDWDLHREPEPVRAGDALVFPDFAAVRRGDPSQRWFIEILGFWTRDYLERKLQLYARARIPNLIFCVDAARKVDDEQLPEAARVVRYKRKIDPRAVLAAMLTE